MKDLKKASAACLCQLVVVMMLLFAAMLAGAVQLGAEVNLLNSSGGGEMTRGPLGLRQVALTLDAGGEAEGFPLLVAALRAAGVRCTFFITGEWAFAHPEMLGVLVAEGHEIGNHTWSHPDLTRLDDNQIRTQILRNEELIIKLTGRNPRPLFRAPYGARDARVLRIAGELGYTSVYWTVDSLDSVDPPKSLEFLVNRVLRQPDDILDGGIILMHVGEPATAAAVPQILNGLQRRGYSFRTVSELGAPPELDSL